MIYGTYNPYITKIGTSSQLREFLLIRIPLLLLARTAYCSIWLLYNSNALLTKTILTVKVVGRQWFWSYQIAGSSLEFDAFMLPENELPLGGRRFMETRQRLILPVETPVLLVFTSRDVIHRWRLPSHLIKMDCISGVLNRTCNSFPHVGVYYGQCSELCGVGHAYIPIVVEVSLYTFWVGWLISL